MGGFGYPGCYSHELDFKKTVITLASFARSDPELAVLGISKNCKYESIELGREIFQLPGFMGEFRLTIDLALAKDRKV